MKEKFNKEIESARKTHTEIKPGIKNLGIRIKTSPTEYKTQISESQVFNTRQNEYIPQ